MERKKIAFLDDGRGIGGAERNLAAMLEHLDKHEIAPVVILFHKDKFYELLHNLGPIIDVVVIKTPPFLSTSLEFGSVRIFNPFAIIYDFFVVFIKSLRLSGYLAKNRVSFLQTNSLFAHICGGLAAKMSRTYCIWHMQDIPSKFFLFGLGVFFLNFLSYIFPNKIIAVSNKVKKVFYATIQEKITVIHNGIDTQRFKIKNKEELTKIKQDLQINDSEAVVGTVSRIVPWKGHRVFLRAACIVSAKFSNIRFLIAGDTTFGKKRYLFGLKNLAKELGIQDKVIFTGFIENIEEALGVMDILVHCSIRPEAFGLDIIEAMALGKPVVATNIGAPVEIIENNKEGLLIEANNPDSLAEAIMSLLVSQAKCSEISKAARLKVEQKFDIRKRVLEFESIYRSLP